MKEKLLTLTIPGSQGSTEIQAPSGVPTGGLGSDGGKAIGFGISLLLIVAVLLALGFIVYGGLSWTMSRGDKDKVQSARNTIIFAMIGLLVALLSFFVVNLIGRALGVNFLNVSL